MISRRTTLIFRWLEFGKLSGPPRHQKQNYGPDGGLRPSGYLAAAGQALIVETLSIPERPRSTSWTLLKTSPTLGVSDSILVAESEMIPCEVSLDFSMSMIA